MTAPLRIVSVVGARPNFMKVAPIARVLARRPDRFQHLLVHTGQHYDEAMSGAFFTALGLAAPDVNLAVKSGSHAEQTGTTMLRLEPVLAKYAPDLVIVVGDVNATLAAALTAKKLGQRVAHVEAGLRSHDWSMPEEINRRATDAISDDLFTTDRFADANLRHEGVSDSRIHLVGNVMIDSLLAHLPAADALAYPQSLGLRPAGYATMTLHRPTNVDQRDALVTILDAIRATVADLPVVFPCHPRTRRRIAEFGLEHRFARAPSQPGIWCTDPIGYLQFLALNRHARLVLTDSGGLQEETTVLGVPCVTLRDTTERPITVEEGTNLLAGTRGPGIEAAIQQVLAARPGPHRTPPLWDGNAAERIVAHIECALRS